jgi:dolichyl-phosphate beta-glucosyltransferase
MLRNKKQPVATVVFPVHNEKEVAVRLCHAIQEFLKKTPTVSAMIVDDGSDDGSHEIISQAAVHSRVSVLRLSRNQGKGRAIRSAFEKIEADMMMFMDGDLAYSLDHIPRVLESLEKYDVVIGSRSMAPQPQGGLTVRRAILGWGFNRLACGILGIDHPDTRAGLKEFRREAAQKIFTRQRLNGFAFDAEILFLSKKLGLQVGQLPAQVSADHTYKNSQLKLIGDSLRCLKDFFRVRWWAATGGYRFS